MAFAVTDGKVVLGAGSWQTGNEFAFGAVSRLWGVCVGVAIF